MKHINNISEYNKYLDEQAAILEIKLQVDNYLADLIDQEFTVNVSKQGSDQISIRIYAPIPGEVFWFDVKDYIIPTIKMLYLDYDVLHTSISLWQGAPFYIDEVEDLDKTETIFGEGGKLELERNELKSVSIIINKSI